MDPISYTLPSGRTVTLKLPTMGDREALQRRLVEEYRADPNGVQRAAMELDMLLRRACLLSDSGAKGLDPDPKFRCADWPLSDMTAFVVFYDALTDLTREEADAAREAAKGFRAGLRAGA